MHHHWPWKIALVVTLNALLLTPMGNGTIDEPAVADDGHASLDKFDKSSADASSASQNPVTLFAILAATPEVGVHLQAPWVALIASIALIAPVSG